MRIWVSPTGLRAENVKRVEAVRQTYLLPKDLPPLLSGLAGQAPVALDRELRANSASYVIADPDHVRVVADYGGNRHLYCHRTQSASGPELMITDDLLGFAGLLPLDDDVARLVPLMKFVPPPLCLVLGAERVPPGVARVYSRRTLLPVRDENFLNDLFGGGTAPISLDEVRDTLAAIASDKARHLSNAAVFLSGGTDSALLLHLLKQCGHLPQAWTATYDTPNGRQEARFAAATASYYGANWRSVSLNKEIALRHLPVILEAIGEPFADVALVAEAVLGLQMREAMGDPKGPIPVFEGEGMDSLMCGSYKFVAERYRGWVSPLLARIPQVALRGANRRTGWGAFKLKVAQAKALLHGGPLFERHLQFILDERFASYVPSRQREQVVATFRSYFDLMPHLEDLNRLSIMNFQAVLPNLDNRKLHVVAACAGINFRLVYQDPRFIRMSTAIPVKGKIARGYGKRIIKDAFRSDLPSHVLTRRKDSFVPPVFDWVYPEHEELLLSSRLFERAKIRSQLREQVAGRQDHLPFLWGLLVTQSWMQRYEAQRPQMLAPLAFERLPDARPDPHDAP